MKPNQIIQLLSNDPDNEITLTAFRLLTMDLLILFHVMNEGTINVLGVLVPNDFQEAVWSADVV